MSLWAIMTIAQAAPMPLARPVPPQNPIRVRLDRKTNKVATLDLETYLRGVLPAEMPVSWPIEALKAQAVAARTFALFRQGQSRAKDFDVDSDVMDQMFLEGAETTKRAEQAIDETRGLVLHTPQGKLIAAYFHSDCGGHTEDARNVWGGGESTGTAGCPFTARANWKLRLTLKQLAAKLRLPVKAIELGERTESGRVARVALALADGSGRTITANDFRHALGYGELKSTAFSISREGETYTFAGRGFGHGVGLCQWGARQMALQGSSFKEILAHYYPSARLGHDPNSILDRHPNLDDEEGDGAKNNQAANFHKGSLSRL
jgi:stage II sporulation protein D